MGAKGKYQDWLENEKLILLEGWARDGLSDEQIAHNMGIALGTYYDWRKKFPKFSEAIKKGKEVVDREVENALYKSAMGYSVDECTYERRFDKKKGTYEMTLIKKVTKHIPPSNTAQIFWLKKRKPDVWGDEAHTNSEALELMYANLDLTEEKAKQYGTISDAT